MNLKIFRLYHFSEPKFIVTNGLDYELLTTEEVAQLLS
jgi:hypothetical protein